MISPVSSIHSWREATIQRGNDGGLLSQVLEEADVFVVGMGIGLGAQELGELIDQKDHSGETETPHGPPDLLECLLPRLLSFKGVAKMGGEFTEDLSEEDVFEELRSPVLDERDLNDQKLSSLEIFPETLERRLLAEAGCSQDSGYRRRRLSMPRK